jgi:hypothetical protein
MVLQTTKMQLVMVAGLFTNETAVKKRKEQRQHGMLKQASFRSILLYKKALTTPCSFLLYRTKTNLQHPFLAFD